MFAYFQKWQKDLSGKEMFNVASCQLASNILHLPNV